MAIQDGHVDMAKIYADQRAFNSQIWPQHDPETGIMPEGFRDRLKDLSLGLVEEALEFLRTFEWKTHRRRNGKVQNMAHSHEELIDMFKYWLSLADLADFPMHKLEELYFAKTRVVRYRYQEEWEEEIIQPCVAVDIDDVLVDYITGLRDWGVAWASTTWAHPDERDRMIWGLQEATKMRRWIDAETARWDSETWKKMKHHFHTNGGWKSLPIFPDAKPFLEWCRKQGYLILLITSRDIDKNPNVFTDTLTWLNQSGLPFDHLWWSNDKTGKVEEQSRDLLSKIMFAVDDSDKFVRQFRSRGVKTYHLKRGLKFEETDPTHDPLTIRSLHDLMAREEHRKETDHVI